MKYCPILHATIEILSNTTCNHWNIVQYYMYMQPLKYCPILHATNEILSNTTCNHWNIVQYCMQPMKYCPILHVHATIEILSNTTCEILSNSACNQWNIVQYYMYMQPMKYCPILHVHATIEILSNTTWKYFPILHETCDHFHRTPVAWLQYIMLHWRVTSTVSVSWWLTGPSSTSWISQRTGKAPLSPALDPSLMSFCVVVCWNVFLSAGTYSGTLVNIHTNNKQVHNSGTQLTHIQTTHIQTTNNKQVHNSGPTLLNV